MNRLRQQTVKNLSYLLPNLAAGFIAGMSSIIAAASFGMLLFSGSLSGHMSTGINLMLVGAGITALVVSLTSSCRITIAGPQDAPILILAPAVAVIASQMNGSAGGQEILLTVVALTLLATLLSGAIFLVLSRLRLGNLVRLVPTAMMGGFLAGTGWLLVQSSFTVMMAGFIDLHQLGLLFQPHNLWHWLPAVLLALTLLAVSRRSGHYLAIPAVIMAAAVIFYGWRWLSPPGLAEVAGAPWLLPNQPVAGFDPLLTLGLLSNVHWDVLAGTAGHLAAVVVVNVVFLLLNARSLAVGTGQEIDLNRELRAAGLANVLSALAGGIGGYHVLSDSMLAHKMGANSRLVGLITAALCALALFSGGTMLALLPIQLLTGLVLFLGLSFLSEWVIEARARLSRLEYGQVLLLLLVIGAFGFVAGMFGALILLAVQYIYRKKAGIFNSLIQPLLSHRQQRTGESRLDEGGWFLPDLAIKVEPGQALREIS